jgi:hypothetical protein
MLNAISQEGSSFFSVEGKGNSGVAVSFDEILKLLNKNLKNKFGIFKIRGFMVVGLSVDSGKGFFKILSKLFNFSKLIRKKN